jgi:hypothetical protein
VNGCHPSGLTGDVLVYVEEVARIVGPFDLDQATTPLVVGDGTGKAAPGIAGSGRGLACAWQRWALSAVGVSAAR